MVSVSLGFATSAEDNAVATTNAPNFSVLQTQDVSTNMTPDSSLQEQRNAPPKLLSQAESTTTTTTTSPPPTTTSDTPPPTTIHTSSLDQRFEAGMIFGEPTGASLKYWFNDTIAIDGALGWAFHQDDIDFYLHSDVLWHKFDVFNVSRGDLPLYFGLGASAKFRDGHDDIWGIRFPVGVNYLFADAPVSLFFEVAPVLDVAPSVRGDYSVGVGARYRF